MWKLGAIPLLPSRGAALLREARRVSADSTWSLLQAVWWLVSSRYPADERWGALCREHGFCVRTLNPAALKADCPLPPLHGLRGSWEYLPPRGGLRGWCLGFAGPVSPRAPLPSWSLCLLCSESRFRGSPGVSFPQLMWEREHPGPARNDTCLKRLPLLTRLSVPLHPPIPLCICSGHTSWVCAARSRLASHYMPANTSTS